MADMIERVARAICEAQTQGEEMWQAFLPEALAAIEAMREPTEAMTSVHEEMAGNELCENADAETTARVWRAMIDAALIRDKRR